MSNSLARVATRVRLTTLAQKLVEEVVQPDDAVVDGTVGNGLDTSWLRSCVQNTGHVIGFDIQGSALASAQATLTESFGTMPDNVHLLQQCHSTLRDSVKERKHNTIGAAMFNLGYLPGGDQSIITNVKTTIIAVEQAVALLRDGGIVTIIVYVGPNNDHTELAAVHALCLKHHQMSFSAIHYVAQNSAALAPQLFVIKRLKDSQSKQ